MKQELKQRLDVYLTENGYFETREKARAMVMSGNIFVNNQRVDKPGYLVKENEKNKIEVKVKNNKLKFVSRGGLKLEKAVQKFKIDLSEKICLDIGASTGGFTDCMLQNGAKKVFAVDVGYGQLAWKLRTNPKVINLERTNIRYLENDQIDDVIDFASIDVSFISLKLVLPVMKRFLKQNGEAVCLVKPQFEVGKGKVGKKGVIKDAKIHEQVVQEICEFVVNELGFEIAGLDFSPIKGPEGNIEYLVHIRNVQNNIDNIVCPVIVGDLPNKGGDNIFDMSQEIKKMVFESHETLRD